MTGLSSRRDGWEPSAGAEVDARFVLVEKLGEGGMAEVWRAFDAHAGIPIALKLLRPEHAARPEAIERLRREGALLAGLSHASIVRGFGVGWHQGRVFIAMELLLGETLGARLRRAAASPVASARTLDVASLAPIVTGICAGLAAAHGQGVVHRDLKPDNVFLVPSPGAAVQVKLLDFGVSRMLDQVRLTQTGEVLGTPRYMSPEQLGAEDDLDGRADVYALGVMTYEALAGRPPFVATTPTELVVAIVHGKVVPLRTVRPDVTPEMEAVVMRAMARGRSARFDSAVAFADAFLEAAGARRSSPGPHPVAARTQALGGVGERASSSASPSALPEVGAAVGAFTPTGPASPAARAERAADAATRDLHTPLSGRRLLEADGRAARTAPSRPSERASEARDSRTTPARGRAVAPTAHMDSKAWPVVPSPVPDEPQADAVRRPSSPGRPPPFLAAGPPMPSRTTLVLLGLLASALSGAIVSGAYLLLRESAASEPAEDAMPAPVPPRGDGASPS